MSIIKYSSIYISIAVLLSVLSVASLFIFGLKPGVDFTGGTTIHVQYKDKAPNIKDITFNKEDRVSHREVSALEHTFSSPLSYEELKNKIDVSIGEGFSYTEIGVTTTGPTLGKEMEKKAFIGIVVAILAILAFISFSFREVSVPVSSWKYGIMAVVTLVHDILIPIGVYAYLCFAYGAQADTLFVVALLTVMAISISDKIVVFDRIRENLKIGVKGEFKDIVDAALRQTFTRSVNTSVTTVLALFALFLFGPEQTKFFSLTLMIGIVVGTYSSIFVASPLLVMLTKKK